MSSLIQDVRYGLRMLAKSPGFTAVAILSLALGIGANTAIFTLINGLMLKSLPVRDPRQLVSFGNPGNQPSCFRKLFQRAGRGAGDGKSTDCGGY